MPCQTKGAGKRSQSVGVVVDDEQMRFARQAKILFAD
jgi:hypothetical protein